MEKSNLVVLQPMESVESKAIKGVKGGLQRIVEAQSIMRKHMSNADCDKVLMGLFIGALDIAQYSLDLQACEIDKLFNK